MNSEDEAKGVAAGADGRNPASRFEKRDRQAGRRRPPKACVQENMRLMLILQLLALGKIYQTITNK